LVLKIGRVLIILTLKGGIMKAYKIGSLFFAFVVCFSCAPQIKVVPLSKEARERNINNGIPYYLPKSYLLITRNFEHIYTHEDMISDNTGNGNDSGNDDGDGDSSDNGNGSGTVDPGSQPAGDVFSYQIIYLPDTSEKYGIKISRGTGTFKGKISLVDGWKFVGINLETDSKTAETIKGFGQAAKDIATLIALSEKSAGRALLKQEDMIETFGNNLINSLTEPDAEIYIYDLSDLSRPVFQWPTP
jgi:hypothetical protein